MIPLVAFTTFLFAPPGSTTAVLPAEIVLLSASYSDHPGPKFAGTFSFATRLPSPAACYSYSSFDLSLTRVNGKPTFADSTRTGGACRVDQFSAGGLSVYIIGTAGATIVNATALASGSFGALAAYQFSGKPWGIWGDYQDSNTTGKTARIGVLLAWGK